MTRTRLQGAALPIAMFIVAIAGLMAIAAASLAMLSSRMALAESARVDAFTAAENALSLALRSAPLPAAVPWQDTITTPQGVTVTSTVTVDAASGLTAPPTGGFSLGEGGAGLLVRHYRITAAATGPQGARALHTQDFHVLAPAAPL